MKLSIVFLIIFCASIALSGLPPTSAKDSADSSGLTTFFFQFPNFTGTHTGPTFSLGVNSIAGGGTNAASAAAGTMPQASSTTASSWTATPTLGVSATTSGTLALASSTASTGLVTLANQGTTSGNAYTFSFPLTGGTNGYGLTTNGSGTTTWTSILTNPMTTANDLIYGGVSGVPTRLANGTTGQVLTATTGSAESWVTPLVVNQAYANKTAAYTTLATDNVLTFNMSGSSNAAYAVTLLTAVGNTGLKQTLVYTTGTGILTVNTTSSQTINGIASGVFTMGTVGDTLTVISDGANWQIEAIKISIAGRYTVATASVTSTDSLVTYTTKVKDPLAQYSSGILTIGVPGWYQINAKALVLSTSVLGDADDVAIYGGGAGTTVQSREYVITALNQDETHPIISDMIYCANGDKVNIKVASQNTSPTLSGNAQAGTFTWQWVGF
jgi:hypothetical protein